MRSTVLLGLLAVLLAVEGTWGIEIHNGWPFLLTVIVAIVFLILTVFSSFKKKSLSHTLSHLGFLVVLSGGLLGATAYSSGQMTVTEAGGESIVISRDGKTFTLPFGIRLKEFRTDFYEDGVSPKQYTSVLEIGGRELTTAVNSPCRFKGFWIYQADYDHIAGEYSVLRVVKDPGLPVVFLGMLLLAFSALMNLRRTWRNRAALPVLLGLAAVFAVLSVARINFASLMPALRSFWFVPHLLMYMLAYSALAVALVLSLAGLFTSRVKETVPRKLLATSSSLLLLGMICGALWAKLAWGDFWAWDPKENWAAATWLLTLVGMHLPQFSPEHNSPRTRLIALTVVIAIAFLAMQITWYGLNYLPSSSSSWHIYAGDL